MASLLQTKTNQLSYSRVPFSKYKDVTAKPYKFKAGSKYESGRNNATDPSKQPKGTVFGASKRNAVSKMLNRQGGIGKNYSK